MPFTCGEKGKFAGRGGNAGGRLDMARLVPLVLLVVVASACVSAIAEAAVDKDWSMVAPLLVSLLF